MYDLSSKFNTFYNSHVVLSQVEQTDLHNKKDLNIQRLKDGLKEYNEENKTSYSIKETCVQGSVAMSTVVQNEDDRKFPYYLLSAKSNRFLAESHRTWHVQNNSNMHNLVP